MSAPTTTGDRPPTPAPNLRDYEAARASFSWQQARDELDQLSNEGLNIAHEAVDRHTAGPARNRAALRVLRKGGGIRDLTYGELREETNKFANVLRALGIGEGDRVFSLTGRIPELYVAALGTLKNASVFSPLFSAFGPQPIRERLSIGDAKALITTEALYRRKVEPIRDSLPELEHVLLVDGERERRSGVHAYSALMASASDQLEIAPTRPETAALLHFTSGTTGRPKGALHVHDAVVAHHATGKLALDLHPADIYWCTADPGWVTGTSYGIIAPLTNATTAIVAEEEFDARRWYETIADQRVAVWYTAPTAVRMLMKAGSGLAREHDLSSLRFIASVGEPLNPEAVRWGAEAFGTPIHDNWWQTETGGIMVANFRSMPVKPGSMGRPLPGIEAGVLPRDERGHVRVRDGTVREVSDPEEVGELALRPGWPSMFRGYVGERERYEKCFAAGWYLSGDLVRRDDDGYYWFVGRGDDVIKSAGHLIGPFEVESTLLEHPAVAEAGVIGVPDETVGEVVKAFVSLGYGYEPSDAMRRELVGFARTRLGAAVAPRQIAFVPTVPRTRSGKIMRRVLKAQELGLPEGDLSTLEGAR